MQLRSSYPLGELEEKVMLAILKLDNDSYGAKVRETLTQAGRNVSVGALYVTLDRLEGKGFIEGREGEVPSSRGGKPRRYFRVTSEGHRALETSQRVIANLRAQAVGGVAA